MTPTTLYLATTNSGKLRDFTHALTPGFALKPLRGLASMPVPEETADTFEGNARIKAIAYSLAAPGLYILADDSGLEVHALGGRPGVRSARYADDLGFDYGTTTDERNNNCLQSQMLDHPENRGARYRCSLVLAIDGRVILTADGTVEGQILQEPRGTGGFGYDPYFLLPDQGQTMAEIDTATRQQHSHRARALAQLLSGIDKAQREADRNARSSRLMAAAPVALLCLALAGFIFSLWFTFIDDTNTGLLWDHSQRVRYAIWACCTLMLSAWACVRALTSRTAVVLCGLISSALFLNCLAGTLPRLWRTEPQPNYQILPILAFSLPLLVLAGFGVRGTIRALRSRPSDDIAQTSR